MRQRNPPKRPPKSKKRPTTVVQVRIDDYLVKFMESIRHDHRLSRSGLVNLALERAFPDALRAFKTENPPIPSET
jgi:hypothetical protein